MSTVGVIGSFAGDGASVVECVLFCFAFVATDISKPTTLVLQVYQLSAFVCKCVLFLFDLSLCTKVVVIMAVYRLAVSFFFSGPLAKEYYEVNLLIKTKKR